MKISVPTPYDVLASLYVANMEQHAQLDETMQGLVDFGTPSVSAADDFLDAFTVTASTEYLPADLGWDGPQLVDEDLFGRILKVLSDDAGDVTIHGRDYLNQHMTETITCTAGTVEGAKAFKYIDKIVTASDLAGDISIGYGTELGLPFVVSDILEEYADGVPDTAPAHTTAVTTDPATATTGDTRGTVAPATTLDGETRVEMVVKFNPNSAGGLYGVAQG